MTTYAVFEPPYAGTAGSGRTSSSLPPVVTETTSTSRARVPSSTSIDVPVHSDATQFTFIELHNNQDVFPLREDHFLKSDFDQICATHDCQADCFNMARVFRASQHALGNSTDGYKADIPVTLFGICSNLASATESVMRNGNETTQSFFPRPLAQISNDSDLLADNLTTCLATTCEMTRRPSECFNYCRPESLLQSPTAFDFSSGLLRCADKLCSNTCGLPFANQDVFGIGVLISYYIQAALLFALAVAVSASAVWQLFRFVTAGVASFFMSPAEVDPLNGYALLAVSLGGCIGPAFTLLLLHSHGIKSWHSTVLCLASWLLNTIIFYMLCGNLSKSLNTIEGVDRALRKIFQTKYCGGSSAMVLCQEWTGSNPMQYLSDFYNQTLITNIHKAPATWAYVTLVLLVLVLMQVIGRHDRPISGCAPIKQVTPTKRRILRKIPWLSPQCWEFLLLLATTTIFLLALRCQWVMVRTYQAMGVVDTHEWSFGQVVAVLIWVPALLEVVESYNGSRELFVET
ncbi:hypothetical protein LA080_004741 [Diaporthe eres]|nr:hypothetical protein LA080_004741 [Diaporthe eres]